MGFKQFSSVFMLLVWLDAQVDETKVARSKKGEGKKSSQKMKKRDECENRKANEINLIIKKILIKWIGLI